MKIFVSSCVGMLGPRLTALSQSVKWIEQPCKRAVNEFWYVLEGRGEIWRDDGVECIIRVLAPGTSIDMPAGTSFQYRNLSDEDLKFICVAMPPWPGDLEASFLDGIWQPTV